MLLGSNLAYVFKRVMLGYAFFGGINLAYVFERVILGYAFFEGAIFIIILESDTELCIF